MVRRLVTYGVGLAAVLGLAAYAAVGSIPLGLIGIGSIFGFVVLFVGDPMVGDSGMPSDLKRAEGEEQPLPSVGPAPPGPE